MVFKSNGVEKDKIQNPSKYLNVLIAIALLLYLLAGIYTQATSLKFRPIPPNLLDDYQAYEEAYQKALNGINPYRAKIGSAFLYPPPALLIADAFGHIPNFYVKVAVMIALNVALLVIMVIGLARYYGYSLRTVWFWIPLALGFAPFLEMLQAGQINMITLFGIFLMYYFEVRVPFLAGFGLGGAILTKFTPIFFTGYLLVRKNFKVLLFTLIIMIAISLIALLRYGSAPFLQFPDAFQRLLSRYPTGIHSQSLGAKLTIFDLQKEQVRLVQRMLLVYLFLVLCLSAALTLTLNQKEPLFILTGFAMTLSPNILWYHHYVFLLLPIFIWMGSSRLKLSVLSWCFFGLLLIQLDRWLLTYGLLIHIFGHLSILWILSSQIRDFVKSKKLFITRPIAE